MLSSGTMDAPLVDMPPLADISGLRLVAVSAALIQRSIFSGLNVHTPPSLAAPGSFPFEAIACTCRKDRLVMLTTSAGRMRSLTESFAFSEYAPVLLRYDDSNCLLL